MNSELKILKSQLEGELYNDDMMRTLYATDASVYRKLPLAVALPKHELDIKLIVAFANDHKISLIPRGAGTSLAGQCVGDGIIVDVSKYMNQIVRVNKEEKWVIVQPGVIRDELNTFLKSYGLFFGPNTSTANRCNIGGMVGNNSCGSTSIVYGSTRDHVLEIEAVLSNGDSCKIKALDQLEFEDKLKGEGLEAQIYQKIHELLSNKDNQEQIRSNYPKATVSRRNTGYALDELLKHEPYSTSDKRFNFCSLLCGSEGTLAFTTQVKLNLVALPKPKDIIVAAHFANIHECMTATVEVMKHHPTACELMDKTILDCTKDNIKQRQNRFFVDGDPEAILMIEFREDHVEKAQEKAENIVSFLKQKNLGYAFPIIHSNSTQKVWELRKAGLGLLANIPGDKKAVACIEDTAVALEDLPHYIKEFSKLIKDFDQKAVYYAHAGAGELHLRPILNLKNAEDVKDFRNISEASAKLVKKYNGSLSGEHGDGRVRSEFIPLVLGNKVKDLLLHVKKAWDPKAILNPGKIVEALPMDIDLRYAPDQKTPEITTQFNFDADGGILRSVEKCNGSGDCRKLNFAGGTMCPSYRATLDEKDSTRGRANILREFLTQNVKENPFDHPEIKEAMDLCLSCKGCKSECPSNIDMATLKSEFLYQYHKSNKIPLRSKLIANIAKLNALNSRFPGLYNLLIGQKWFKNLLGIAPQRAMPLLAKSTFRKWLNSFRQGDSDRKVYLFVDEYTNYFDVDIGKKTVLLFNALGYEVLFCEHTESGRAFISKGFLDQAKAVATKNIEVFSDLISETVPLIGIEPSAILGFRDEYPNLVDKKIKQKALNLSNYVFTVEEFLDIEIEKGRIKSDRFTKLEKDISIHGHCHQKVLSSVSHMENILSLPENYSVKVIPSGCCGMAGSFGYEKEHYDLSMKIGEQVLFTAIKESKKDSLIAAAGTSCRHQIKDGTRRDALHPIEILYEALIP